MGVGLQQFEMALRHFTRIPRGRAESRTASPLEKREEARTTEKRQVESADAAV